MVAKKVYVVRRGRQTGLFNTWSECQKQVQGYPGAIFKSFTNLAEAQQWLGGAEINNPKVASISKPTYSAVTNDEAPDYIIYTDGSCLRNPDGPGGWAAVIMDQNQGKLTELHDGQSSTTNNRMELTAAKAALEFVPVGAVVDLYTDSQYLKNAFTKKWLVNWQRRGWLTASGAPVKNQDLWQVLAALFSSRKVNFHWVKGHVGIEHNERCDQLARREALRYS